MQAPPNVEVNETLTGFFWFEDGILCSTTKPNAPKLTSEQEKQETEKFIARYGKQKFCLLIDGKHIKPNSKEERKKAAETLPEFVNAIAIIVHNPLGRIVVNLFVGLQKPPYPLKIFKPGEEAKAKEWLKQYL
ncbi:MAG TPA: STAS/SEC14 domain-containing protein [Flavobacteriales bacterium]|nr:STAS/SEC14 domain-containing protein [Flavobacteriales bacterium]